MSLVLLLLLTMPPALDQKCASYEPDQVVLKGTIRRHTFPGPPNYESVAKGDRAERVWLLHLAQPICVSANSESEKETGVSDVQMVVEKYDKTLVGRKVVATGTLFHWQTGHHHTKVLLKVRSIRRD
jgi:hypothetical protein